MSLMLIESKKRLSDQGRMLEITACGPFPFMSEEPEIWRDADSGPHAWVTRPQWFPYWLCLYLQPGRPLWEQSLQAWPPGS